MKSTADTKRLDIVPLIDALADAVSCHIDTNTSRIVGIHRGGVWLVEWLVKRLKITAPIGSLDISFYRDDFSTRGLQPQVKPSNIPFSVDDAQILLVDDVAYIGRTLRAALNEIFDYGRPATIKYACLIDLDRRQLPIRPDIYMQKR